MSIYVGYCITFISLFFCRICNSFSSVYLTCFFPLDMRKYLLF
uniref:Uncharacterized protein n=1 Tax=Rhizophora mucronata TaxID=61149 RepID=A0A2P2QIC6_RHIMU